MPQQLIQIGQTVLLIAVPVVLFAIVYFLSKIKPVGEFFATLVHVPGIVFRSIAGFLLPFGVQEESKNSKYPGLRTIVLVIASVFSIVATVADGFLTLQALQALTDDTSLSITLPDSLAFLNYSSGWLFLSLPAITGMILLDRYFQVVPEEARIFNVPSDDTAKLRFQRFILITFMLSLGASIAFNALKPAYMQDSGSWETLVLRIAVFVVLGGMLPLCMALTIYIVSLGLHSLVSLALCIVWLIALVFARILAFLARRFSDEEIGKDDVDIVVVKEVITKRSSTDILQDQSETPLLPDASLNGHNGHNEHFDLSLDKDQLSTPGKNGDTETSNVEKETSNNKTSLVESKKSQKPKKQKLNVRRTLTYTKVVEPASDQVNGNHRNSDSANGSDPVEEKPHANDQPIYKDQFASKEEQVTAVLQKSPNATVEQLAKEAECSIRTAQKWIERYKQQKEN